jgi:hypothetical protein
MDRNIRGPLRLSSIPTIWTERLVSISASHGNLSSAPSRNLLNMTPDLQGNIGQCMLGSSSPEASPPQTLPCSSPLCYLLAWSSYLISTDSTPLLISLWPTLPPSLCSYITVFLTSGAVC